MQEYWTIDLKLTNDKGRLPFLAKFHGLLADGKKMNLTNEDETMAIVEELKKSDFLVKSVKRKETKRRSAPPFTTSTLQQEASRNLCGKMAKSERHCSLCRQIQDASGKARGACRRFDKGF